ncbi:hypothetical protein BJ875DRAFT_442596 [Amylocarpus encephaloides]|uniref:Uncharacterized protein n=1 Tax=Amylocarpus encephaloides TaxID=45428 RepID=A0A9P7YH22_9HELO|nr:hypothetical protein BJ875DRAFT_442596 [Amylocarpus encephaloides]
MARWPRTGGGRSERCRDAGTPRHRETSCGEPCGTSEPAEPCPSASHREFLEVLQSDGFELPGKAVDCLLEVASWMVLQLFVVHQLRVFVECTSRARRGGHLHWITTGGSPSSGDGKRVRSRTGLWTSTYDMAWVETRDRGSSWRDLLVGSVRPKVMELQKERPGWLAIGSAHARRKKGRRARLRLVDVDSEEGTRGDERGNISSVT